jgi:hypothetical protein
MRGCGSAVASAIRVGDRLAHPHAFTVGMASDIAILEGLHLVIGRNVYLRISTFRIRIFSVAFALAW